PLAQVALREDVLADIVEDAVRDVAGVRPALLPADAVGVVGPGDANVVRPGSALVRMDDVVALPAQAPRLERREPGVPGNDIRARDTRPCTPHRGQSAADNRRPDAERPRSVIYGHIDLLPVYDPRSAPLGQWLLPTELREGSLWRPPYV